MLIEGKGMVMSNNPAKEPLFQGDLVNTSRVIYTPSEFAKSSLFHIQEIGSLQATKPHSSRRENLTSYLFFLVHSGSGTLFYRDRQYAVSAGDCVFIDCRHTYYHETGKDLWNLSWIHFYGPSAEDIYLKYAERGGSPVFRPADLPRYENAFRQIYDIALSDSFVRDMRINEALSHLLVLLMEDSWNPENAASGKSSILPDIRSFLELNYTRKITLDELSERYFINKYYLTRIFKEQFGISISGYLQRLRITRVKQELRFSSKSIDEIALETGLNSGYYLSRLFSKVEGLSPSDYRKKWK